MENFWSRPERNFAVYLLFHQKRKSKITGNVKSLNYKPSPTPSGEFEMLLQLTFSCPVGWVRDKMKHFTDDKSCDDSDIDIDLESVDVVEDDYDDEEANKIKPVSLTDDKEITNTLMQQEAACIVINDD